jgi:hypothetical protein
MKVQTWIFVASVLASTCWAFPDAPRKIRVVLPTKKNGGVLRTNGGWTNQQPELLLPTGGAMTTNGIGSLQAIVGFAVCGPIVVLHQGLSSHLEGSQGTQEGIDPSQLSILLAAMG